MPPPRKYLKPHRMAVIVDDHIWLAIQGLAKIQRPRLSPSLLASKIITEVVEHLLDRKGEDLKIDKLGAIVDKRKAQNANRIEREEAIKLGLPLPRSLSDQALDEQIASMMRMLG